MSSQVEALQQQVKYYRSLARKVQAIQRIINETPRYIPKQFNIIQVQYQSQQETLDKIYSLYQDIEDNCYMITEGKQILDCLMPKDYLSLEIVYKTFSQEYQILKKVPQQNILIKEIASNLGHIVNCFYELDPCLLPFARNFWIIQDKHDHNTLERFMRHLYVIYVNRGKFEEKDFIRKMFQTEYKSIDDILEVLKPYLNFHHEEIRKEFKEMYDLLVDIIFTLAGKEVLEGHKEEEHEEEEHEEDSDDEPIRAQTQPTLQNKKFNLGFVNRNYGIDIYQKFYIPIKNIRIEIGKLSKKNPDVQQILNLITANHINEETFKGTIKKCTEIMQKYERRQDPPYPIIRKNLTKLQTAIQTYFK